MSSNQRVAGHRGDAALVVMVPRHLDVALETPCGAPAVLHQPVVLAVVSAVADDQNTVVELFGAAFRLPVDAAAVELETRVAGVDGH